jgi:release factor glutamine methyltransferase
MNLQSPSILEVGTGSGCISISVAGEIDCVIDSADIDENSLLTAKENAEGYKLKGTVNFIKLDFLKDDIVIDNYNIVICNPPYIPKDEYLTLPEEIKNFEPEQALTDYSDGLEFYRRIFALYNSSKIKPAVLFEIGDGKKELVEKLLNDYSIKNFEFHKDLLNIFRVLEINC